MESLKFNKNLLAFIVIFQFVKWIFILIKRIINIIVFWRVKNLLDIERVLKIVLDHEINLMNACLIVIII